MVFSSEPNDEDVFTLKSCPKEVIVVDFVDDLILDAKLLAKQFVKLPGTDVKYKLAIATIMLNDFAEKATTYILGDLSFCVFLRCLANKNSFTTSSQKIEV